jgi:hypothetical protein
LIFESSACGVTKASPAGLTGEAEGGRFSRSPRSFGRELPGLASGICRAGNPTSPTRSRFFYFAYEYSEWQFLEESRDSVQVAKIEKRTFSSAQSLPRWASHDCFQISGIRKLSRLSALHIGAKSRLIEVSGEYSMNPSVRLGARRTMLHD